MGPHGRTRVHPAVQPDLNDWLAHLQQSGPEGRQQAQLVWKGEGSSISALWHARELLLPPDLTSPLSPGRLAEITTCTIEDWNALQVGLLRGPRGNRREEANMIMKLLAWHLNVRRRA
eukprot:12174331-Heterocapsa_arctica.AAC.1